MLSIPDGFTDLERLGDGSFGCVELVQREDDGALFALKILEKKAGIESAENEIEVLNQVSSPYIVNIYDVFRDNGGISIMIDPCLGGSLRLKIQNRAQAQEQFTTEEILTYITQILFALKELHSHGFAHRDLSTMNIMFVKDGEKRIQLIDFGVSGNFKKNKLTGSVGTPNYMSPEMKRGLPHGPETDMYSLGVILFELCELRLPKPGEDTSFNHPSLDPLLQNLLTEDPLDRANVDDCLSFPDICDIAEQFIGAKRIKLTAYDWRPTSDNDDIDIDNDFDMQNWDDIPPPEAFSQPPEYSGQRRSRHDPDFDAIQKAERVMQEAKEKNNRILAEKERERAALAQKARAQSKLAQKKWNEQRGDLVKHSNEYKHRLEAVRQQQRRPQRLLAPLSASYTPEVSADELEQNRVMLERLMGTDRLCECLKSLEADPLLSPTELGVTPRLFDMLSKLLRLEKDIFG